MLIYLLAIITAVATVVFHFPGLNGFYMEYWWYDIFMHILGGFSIGLLIYLLIKIIHPTVYRLKSYIIIGTFLIGVAWEFFEVYFQLTGYPIGTRLYYIDTVLDLIDDIIGGLLAAYIITKYRKKNF